MWDLFQEIELPLTRVLIEMESAGIYLDCYRLGEITGKIQDQMEGLETCIYELAGEKFNLGSPQQLGRVLFERLGLPRQRKTKTGYSTDAKTLEACASSHPIVGHLLNHRELSKLMSTYLLALPQCVDPRDRAAAHHLPPDRGRHRPALVERPQPAEHPRAHRAGRPDPAVLHGRAGQPAGGRRLLADRAAHHGPPVRGAGAARGASPGARTSTRRTAAEVFGMAEDEVDTTHRRYAKAVNFGIMYGISAFGLSQNLGIEREEAAAYIQRYFERLPRVKAFIERPSRPPGARATSPRCSAAAGPSPSWRPATSRSARWASGWR